MFFKLKIMAFLGSVFVLSSLLASDAHVSCSGDVEILKSSQKITKEARSIIFSRHDSAEILVTDKTGRSLMKIYPWFGIDSKKIDSPSNTQIKINSDKYFEVSVLDEKKTVFCEVIYE